MSQEHVMVDIETLGTNSTSVIVAIGAVRFDIETLQLSDSKFKCTLDIQAQANVDLACDVDTLLWWLRQGEPARMAIFGKDAQSNALHPADALENFVGFCEGAFYLWSNGPTFDSCVLQEAFKRFEVKWPFKYNADRDMRTVMTIAKAAGWDGPNENIYQHLVAHHALHDAIRQAHYVCDALAFLKG